MKQLIKAIARSGITSQTAYEILFHKHEMDCFFKEKDLSTIEINFDKDISNFIKKISKNIKIPENDIASYYVTKCLESLIEKTTLNKNNF
jgi:hypothetical protein